MKLDKGASFIEFYYTGLLIDNSSELVKYIRENELYYKKMKEEIQEQFRQKYRNLKRMEVENGQKN